MEYTCHAPVTPCRSIAFVFHDSLAFLLSLIKFCFGFDFFWETYSRIHEHWRQFISWRNYKFNAQFRWKGLRSSVAVSFWWLWLWSSRRTWIFSLLFWQIRCHCDKSCVSRIRLQWYTKPCRFLHQTKCHFGWAQWHSRLWHFFTNIIHRKAYQWIFIQTITRTKYNRTQVLWIRASL